ncbi:MAG: hypothetical protein AAGJ46_07710 [Planctomycetota bacterium]
MSQPPRSKQSGADRSANAQRVCGDLEECLPGGGAGRRRCAFPVQQGVYFGPKGESIEFVAAHAVAVTSTRLALLQASLDAVESLLQTITWRC